MDENTAVNGESSSNANVTFSIPLSDIHYSMYRKELIETAKKQKDDPDVYLSKCGILIRSHQTDECVYEMSRIAFGNKDNIINTLALTLIEVLKESAGTQVEKKKRLLRSFLSFFEAAAKEDFFGSEAEEENSSKENSGKAIDDLCK